MEVFCAWHKKFFPNECDTKGDFYMGKKEPLAKTARTDGLCPRCSELQQKEIDNYLEKGEVVSILLWMFFLRTLLMF